MQPEELLTKLNLSPEQAQIYLSLLKNGAQSASQLAKSTKVKRTYIYSVCASLSKLGLLKSSLKDKTSLFHPASPDTLTNLADQLELQAKNSRTSLENILPDLQSLFRLTDSRPVVTYYEGLEGVKKAYLDTIKEDKTLLSIVETSKVDKEVYNWVTTKYVQARIKAGINVKAIVATGSKTKQYISLDQAQLRESIVVDSTKFPFENEIIIYGDKVSLIKHKAGEKLLGIIIDNPGIAATFRSWFEMTWELH